MPGHRDDNLEVERLLRPAPETWKAVILHVLWHGPDVGQLALDEAAQELGERKRWARSNRQAGTVQEAKSPEEFVHFARRSNTGVKGRFDSGLLEQHPRLLANPYPFLVGLSIGPLV